MSMNFLVLSHNFVSNTCRLSFMKLKLSIYDHGVVMQVMFLQDILVTEELLPFGFQNVNDFFCPQPKISKQ